MIVRVIITNDTSFSEKYYCIIARPSQPDYLLLNYLKEKVTVCDGRKEHKNENINCADIGPAVASSENPG